MAARAILLLISLLLHALPTGGYVHDPRNLRRVRAVSARSQAAWGEGWEAKRRLKFNALLRQLHTAALEYEDVIEWYTYHPEAVGKEVGGIIQSLIPPLSVLAGEGLDDHLLDVDDGSAVSTAPPTAVAATAAGAAGACPAAGRCSGPIPSFEAGRNASLPYADYILVLASAPSHFEYRQTMRDTFLSPTALSRHDTKRLFAVGQVREPQLEAQLFQEQQMHGDLLRTPSFDGYRNLSLKVFEAYDQVLARFRFRWIVRCDDNNIVRMDRVLNELAKVKRKHELRVWGNVHKDAIVHRDRRYRNYELDFSGPAYPLFPTGCLHALTYETAYWVACVKPDLRRFKSADDTTLGIWLSVSPHKVRMTKSMFPLRDAGCNPDALLFRREDPPVTEAVIQQAWERWRLCGNFCACEGAVAHSLSGAQGTNCESPCPYGSSSSYRDVSMLTGTACACQGCFWRGERRRATRTLKHEIEMGRH